MVPPLLLTVADYQIAARDKLPKAIYEYLTSGADDEQTVLSNETAYAQHWVLRPRVLRPMTPSVSTATTLFGHSLRLPLFASPAGVHGLFHPDGECYTAATCRDFGIPFGLSQHSTRSIETIAHQIGSGTSNFWYQVYILKDRSRTVDMIRRVVMSGAYTAIVFTVDSIRFGVRHVDARNGFNALPYPHRLVNYDASYHDENPDETYNSQQNPAWDQNSEQMFDPHLSLADIGWIKSIIRDHITTTTTTTSSTTTRMLPVIVKGVMTAEDAVLCVQAGADAIIVSNHGGRQLDGCLATIDALPAIVTALRVVTPVPVVEEDGGDDCDEDDSVTTATTITTVVPVLLDGGIRRGTDILKALALGATAVGIGRPLFYGLAVNDLPGLLRILQRELETAMVLCGVRTIADISTTATTMMRSTTTTTTAVTTGSSSLVQHRSTPPILTTTPSLPSYAPLPTIATRRQQLGSKL